MRIVNRRRFGFFIVILVVIVVLLTIPLEELEKRIYSIHYKQDILISASNYGVEPYWIAAIIKAETNFKNGKVSKKGALGLMQLMPNTAKWVAEQAGFTNVTEELIRDKIDLNIEMGTWYLHTLYHQFDEDIVVATAAYNAGPGNVRRWLEEGTWEGTEATISDIPFGETRHYVKKVLTFYYKYKGLYPDL